MLQLMLYTCDLSLQGSICSLPERFCCNGATCWGAYRIRGRACFHSDLIPRSAPILSLPPEVLQECFLYLVDVDPPDIYKRGQTHRCGWLVGLWVCHAMRSRLYGHGLLWARAYTQLPPILGIVRALARNCDLHYRVTEDTPNVLPIGIRMGLPRDYDARLQELVDSADFASCAVVQVRNRWGGVAHLARLRQCSPLPRLRTLDITHDYYKFDTEFEAQQCVMGLWTEAVRLSSHMQGYITGRRRAQDRRELHRYIDTSGLLGVGL